MKNFEARLSGGHPNSLGNTIEVVDEVLADPSKKSLKNYLTATRAPMK